MTAFPTLSAIMATLPAPSSLVAFRVACGANTVTRYAEHYHVAARVARASLEDARKRGELRRDDRGAYTVNERILP